MVIENRNRSVSFNRFIDGQTIIVLTGEFVVGQTIYRSTHWRICRRTDKCQLTSKFVDGQTSGQLTDEFVDGQTSDQLTT